MRWIFIYILALGCMTAKASPCDGIGRTLSPENQQALAGPIARQLHVEKVEVLNTFKYEGWRIIYVETFVSDEPFLFYSADPVKNRYVALWAGAASGSEEQSIKKWTIKNASGIPEKLAGCFAWYVTKGHRK